MSENLISVAEYKELRGWILQVLYNVLPRWIGLHSICTSLIKCGFTVSEFHVHGHLRYLEEKEYIKLQEASEMGITRHMAKLTSKGVDLVEGNLEDDPGITVKNGGYI